MAETHTSPHEQVPSRNQFKSTANWRRSTTQVGDPTNLFRDSSDIGETFPEDNKDSTSTTAEGRGRTVKGSVASSEDNDVAVELGKGALARTHTYMYGCHSNRVNMCYIFYKLCYICYKLN